jgi:hypothetical protein
LDFDIFFPPEVALLFLWIDFLVEVEFRGGTTARAILLGLGKVQKEFNNDGGVDRG